MAIWVGLLPDLCSRLLGVPTRGYHLANARYILAAKMNQGDAAQ